jgi:hypothetical protein
MDLPLELAGAAMTQESNEIYWKLRSQARWTNCDPSKHGDSYKQLFFERNLQDVLEECASIPQSSRERPQMMSANRLARHY